MTLTELKQAIAKLSSQERAELRAWLTQLDVDRSELKKEESPASKLGRLAGRTFADLKKRLRDT